MNSSSVCLTLASGCRERTVILALLVLLHLSAVTVRSQGQITALEKNLRRADPTTEVTCIRYRTKRDEPRVTVSMAFGIGDELISNRGTVTVKARCGTATELILSGPFRVRFLRSGNQGCSIYSYPKSGGRINVSSSAPTNVQSGEVRLATRRTNYVIKTSKIKKRFRVRSGKRTRIRITTRIQQEVIAFDDPIDVTVGGLPTLVVDPGEKLVTTRGVVKTTNITIKDTEGTAADVARMEVSDLPLSFSRAERIEAFSILKEAHQRVLGNPRGQRERMNLKDEQIKYGVPVGNLPSSSIKPTESAPTEDIKQPAETKPSTETKPATETKPPEETKRPAETKPPAETKAPAEVKGPEDHKPIRRPGYWDVELKANTKTVLPLTLNNLCRQTHRFRIELGSLLFAHLSSNADLVIKGFGTTEAMFEFEEMKPGVYSGNIRVRCKDCGMFGQCSGQVRLNVTVKD